MEAYALDLTDGVINDTDLEGNTVSTTHINYSVVEGVASVKVGETTYPIVEIKDGEAEGEE